MAYIATVEDSRIDVTNIRDILIQGSSAHPVIQFVLDPALDGYTWTIRGTYLGSGIAVTSGALAKTESAQSILVNWTVSADFTTYYGEMQLALVGSNGTGTEIVKSLGSVNIQRDWSIGSMGAITLDLFEQLMAQATAAISKYPYIDEVTGRWFVWSPTLGVWVDTGKSANGSPSYWYTGTGITGTATTPTAFPSSGITEARLGDMYLNETTSNVYRCTLVGNAATALWSYRVNIKGAQGATGPQGSQGPQGETGPQGEPGATGADGADGVGIPAGGSIRQVIAKASAAEYDAAWATAVLQYSTMPTAEAGNLGQIAQFTGTTETYTHGHIYECVSSGGGSPVYSWAEIVYGDPNSVSYSAQTGKTDAEKAQARTNVAAAPENAASPNLVINGNFAINQLAKSGTVTLVAGEYGHDMWKAGAGGCTYTFAKSENITTLTISAGSLIQIVEGLNLQSGTVCLSWSGTAQGKIGAGSYSTSGVTGSATGGTNLNVEFNTGTLSKVQLSYGAVAIPFVLPRFGDDLLKCQYYYEKSYNYGTAPGTATTATGLWFTMCSAVATANLARWPLGKHPIFKVNKRVVPTITLYSYEGNVGQWSIGGAVRATVASPDESGFSVANGTGGTITPSNVESYGHWVADARL